MPLNRGLHHGLLRSDASFLKGEGIITDACYEPTLSALYQIYTHAFILPNTARNLADASCASSGIRPIRSGPACTSCTAKLKIWMMFTNALKQEPISSGAGEVFAALCELHFGKGYDLTPERRGGCERLSREHYTRAGQPTGSRTVQCVPTLHRLARHITAVCPSASLEATAAFVSLTTPVFVARLLLLTLTYLHAPKLLPAACSESRWLVRKARVNALGSRQI
jgi:hypothetical protein